MVKTPAHIQGDLQAEGQTSEDLLEILKKYIDKQGISKPYLIKDGKKVIL